MTLRCGFDSNGYECETTTRLRARLAEALWLVENGTPHDRMISAGRWDEWLNRRNAILGWADDSGRPADQPSVGEGALARAKSELRGFSNAKDDFDKLRATDRESEHE